MCLFVPNIFLHNHQLLCQDYPSLSSNFYHQGKNNQFNHLLLCHDYPRVSYDYPRVSLNIYHQGKKQQYATKTRQRFLPLKFLLFIFLYYFEFYYYLFSLLHLLKLIYYLLFFWKISYMSRQKLYQKNFSLEQDFSFKLLIPFLQWISRKSFGKMLYQSIFIPNFW